MSNVNKLTPKTEAYYLNHPGEYATNVLVAKTYLQRNDVVSYIRKKKKLPVSMEEVIVNKTIDASCKRYYDTTWKTLDSMDYTSPIYIGTSNSYGFVNWNNIDTPTSSETTANIPRYYYSSEYERW